MDGWICMYVCVCLNENTFISFGWLSSLTIQLSLRLCPGHVFLCSWEEITSQAVCPRKNHGASRVSRLTQYRSKAEINDDCSVEYHMTLPLILNWDRLLSGVPELTAEEHCLKTRTFWKNSVTEVQNKHWANNLAIWALFLTARNTHAVHWRSAVLHCYACFSCRDFLSSLHW